MEKKPYFNLHKNEHGNLWLLYMPDESGIYRCWEPIKEDFWREFEKLLNHSRQADVNGALPLAEKLLRSTVSADPNVLKGKDECDGIIFDLYQQAKELVRKLNSNDN